LSLIENDDETNGTFMLTDDRSACPDER